MWGKANYFILVDGITNHQLIKQLKWFKTQYNKVSPRPKLAASGNTGMPFRSQFPFHQWIILSPL
jgi:hypothetical protein